MFVVGRAVMAGWPHLKCRHAESKPNTVLRGMADEGYTLDEIQAVKQVVEQIGAEKVQQLAGVLVT
jgi:hypothetical protein